MRRSILRQERMGTKSRHRGAKRSTSVASISTAGCWGRGEGGGLAIISASHCGHSLNEGQCLDVSAILITHRSLFRES